jgi:hypothetical protein
MRDISGQIPAWTLLLSPRITTRDISGQFPAWTLLLS